MDPGKNQTDSVPTFDVLAATLRVDVGPDGTSWSHCRQHAETAVFDADLWEKSVV